MGGGEYSEGRTAWLYRTSGRAFGKGELVAWEGMFACISTRWCDSEQPTKSVTLYTLP